MKILDIILIIISGAGLIHAILISLFILTNSSKKTLSKSLMVIMLLLMAFRVGKSVLFNFAEDVDFFIILFGLSLLLILGPSLYFYIKALTIPNYILKKIHFNYFWPFALMLVLSFIATEKWFVENGKFWAFILLSFVYGHLAFYIFKSWKVVKKTLKKYNQTFTKSQNTVLIWSKYVIAGVFIIWISYVLNIFEDKVPYILGPIIYSITIYLLTFIAIKLGVINYDGMVFKDNSNENMLYNAINSLIIKEKLYLNSNLDLNQIAKILAISVNQVSHLINEKAGTNFNNYINKFRIEEAKNMISNDKEKRFTIASIAYDVGFNSISTFNTAFKKTESTTPTQFRDSLA